MLAVGTMTLELSHDGERKRVELANGSMRLGGGAGDDIPVPGLEPAFLELTIEGERAVVKAREPIAFAGVLFPAKVPRLLVPGETVRLPQGIELRQLPAAPATEKPATAVVLKKLLADVVEPEHTAGASLTCLTGLDLGRRFPLDFARGVIGRGYQVAIRIRDRAVSRHHARIVAAVGAYRIEDLGGCNGVYVNGKRVHRSAVLSPGDVVELGHSLLRFEGPRLSPPPPPQEASGGELDVDGSEAEPEALPAHRSGWEWLLLGAGVTLAIAGLWVSFRGV
ncbi:MAG: FHA domain-containing protein [Myxococcota bacterium]